jgi:hypothetical protein
MTIVYVIAGVVLIGELVRLHFMVWRKEKELADVRASAEARLQSLSGRFEAFQVQAWKREARRYGEVAKDLTATFREVSESAISMAKEAANVRPTVSQIEVGEGIDPFPSLEDIMGVAAAVEDDPARGAEILNMFEEANAGMFDDGTS